MKKLLLSTIVILSFIVYAIATHKTTQQPLVTTRQIVTPTTIPSNTPEDTPESTIPTSTPVSTPTPTSSRYKNGTYTGDPEDAFYGTIQVSAIISGGKLVNINFLQYPNDRSTSIAINSQADPMLAQEAIQTQSANVDIISGATDSSEAFIQSLQTALNQAQG